ncbi:MAG: diaminopimelate epimerase [Sphingobacteriaceae bacterium]|nr:diaminopimelate epimerase [Sphingobacteriaceae bacterium]
MHTIFYKYQGCGNDFILIDNRENNFSNTSVENIKKLCDRRFGIGADGLMLLQNKNGFDFEMHYYNADGNIGSMCGNGGRCIVSFAKYLGIIENETTFLAVDGSHYAKISADGNWVELKMIAVETIEEDGDALVLNTGSPHYVLQVDNLNTMDVFSEGKSIRYNSTYKNEGINVNFITLENEILNVRTYERGVEDETFACGTGATAAALAMAKIRQQTGKINTPIKVLGGDLKVTFQYDGTKFTDIFLCGPAQMVFKAEL